MAITLSRFIMSLQGIGLSNESTAGTGKSILPQSHLSTVQYTLSRVVGNLGAPLDVSYVDSVWSDDVLDLDGHVYEEESKTCEVLSEDPLTTGLVYSMISSE